MKRILVTDYTWGSTDVEASILAGVGVEIIEAQVGDEDELLALAPEADAILTCFARVPGSVIRAGRRLLAIGRYGIGVDNIDVATATELGIPVTNVPAYCLDEVSDHAMALLLACARRVCLYTRAVRRGDWTLAAGAPMHRLRGQTLGILGFGKIGQTLAPKAQAFGLHVIAHDPFVAPDMAERRNVELVDLDAIFSKSDFLSIHLPLTAETRGLVSRERLRQMKPTSVLINTARGPIIDQPALVEALQAGWVAGAGLDVYEEETLPAGHPLLSLPNVVTTPHVAFYSEESLIDLRTLATRNVAAVLAGRRPAWVVNPSVLNLPRWAHLRSDDS